MTPLESRRTVRYAERLAVPWWSWPPALVAAGVLAAEVWISAASAPPWLLLGVGLALTVALMLWLSRIRITVTNDELRVDDARLPLAVIAQAIPLDAAGKRELLGVGAHPLAFVIQRPWIAGAVQIMLNDPADPTPYWVLTTRHPTRLADSLTHQS